MQAATATLSSIARPRSDADLAMCRYADGDDAAFAEVYAALAPQLCAMLRRLCRCDQLARDLTQETFLHMHRARSSFARERRVVPWAYAIARNCFVSHVRGAEARRKLASLDAGAFELQAGPDADAEATAAARQLAQAAASTLSDMTWLHREAYLLLRCEERSVADAAAAIGATPTAVKLRAFRAYEQLRASLSAAGLDTARRNPKRRSAAACSEPVELRNAS